MHRIYLSLLTVLAAVVLPQVMSAEEVKRPEGPRPEMKQQRPSPEAMFERLDANHDGAITTDEIPAGMPEPRKEMLQREIKNHEGKLTLAQWTEAIKKHRPGPRPEGGPVPPPQGRHSQAGPPPQHPDWRPQEGRSWHMDGGGYARGDRPWHGPDARRQPPCVHCCCFQQGGHMGPPHRPAWSQTDSPRPPMLDAKAIFARLDQDKDGKLSLEEFSAGLRHLRRALAGEPERKAATDPKAIEAKLAALEKEKVDAKAGLKKAEERLKARLAALDKQQAEVLATLEKAKQAEKASEDKKKE
jgi:hypothetical protein